MTNEIYDNFIKKKRTDIVTTALYANHYYELKRINNVEEKLKKSFKIKYYISNKIRVELSKSKLLPIYDFIKLKQTEIYLNF